jgi:hypothetical protein
MTTLGYTFFCVPVLLSANAGLPPAGRMGRCVIRTLRATAAEYRNSGLKSCRGRTIVELEKLRDSVGIAKGEYRAEGSQAMFG